jgi:hypothetical protein
VASAAGKLTDAFGFVIDLAIAEAQLEAEAELEAELEAGVRLLTRAARAESESLMTSIINPCSNGYARPPPLHRGRHQGSPRHAVGGISMSAMAFEIDQKRVQKNAPLVIAAARKISQALGYRPSLTGRRIG